MGRRSSSAVLKAMAEPGALLARPRRRRRGDFEHRSDAGAGVGARRRFGNGAAVVKRGFEGDGRTWCAARATQAPAARRLRASERRRRLRWGASALWPTFPSPSVLRPSLVRPGIMLRSVVGAQAANIMPGPVRSRAPISQACSNASVRRRGNTRRLGDRVPVGTSDGRRRGRGRNLQRLCTRRSARMRGLLCVRRRRPRSDA